MIPMFFQKDSFQRFFFYHIPTANKYAFHKEADPIETVKFFAFIIFVAASTSFNFCWNPKYRFGLNDLELPN